MKTGYDPDLMSAEERLEEVASIIATGIVRLFNKRAKQSENSEIICLDKSAEQSVHVMEKTDHGRSP
ncbi:hypothetical protein [Magnetococcus sp. PR-3]|uniref:hypothetical protein n=1 Tax=Magnetococcus sp. PR-3 TaxID=3120355 RepID=UPI002FCE523A